MIPRVDVRHRRIETPESGVRICFLSAEYSPFAKSGSLGDVAAALTRQLARRGHDVRTFIPLHGQMELRGVDLAWLRA